METSFQQTIYKYISPTYYYMTFFLITPSIVSETVGVVTRNFTFNVYLHFDIAVTLSNDDEDLPMETQVWA